MTAYTINQRRKGFISGMSLTSKIIIVNLFIYIISIFLLASKGEAFFTNYLALTPSLILSGKSLWTFLTSMFMHGSFFHLFANMFSLFFVGGFLEKIIGKKRFFWVYIISGLVGSVFYVGGAYLFGGLNVPAVGASGAIFGLLGVLAVLVPFSRIYLIIGPLILIVLEVLAGAFLPPSIFSTVSFLVNVLILLMIFALFSFNPRYRKFAIPLELPMWLLPIIAIVPLMVISYFVPLPIGNSAHIGGLVIGLLYGFYLRNKFPRKTAQLSRHFR